MKSPFRRYKKLDQLIIIAALSLSCSLASANELQDQFFKNLTILCDSQFVGEMTFPLDGQDSFAGKILVAKFNSCSEQEIRVPFLVGEDASRTWIINHIEGGDLQLKHDHRHADGTPDEVTMYGGVANFKGTALSQSFEADAYTAELIPAAATNIWTISISDDKTIITYHLERNAAPRFTAVLKRQP